MTNILLYSAFHLEQACFSSRTVTASSQPLKHWKIQSALCSSCKDHFVGISSALKRQGKALEGGFIARMETNTENKLLQFNS